MFYAASLIREQSPESGSQWDYRLPPVYLVGLMEFSFDEAEEYLHHVQLIKKGTGEVFYDKLGFVFVEIPKFNKTAEELQTELDKWFFLLKNLSRLDKIPVILQKRIFIKLS